MHRAHAGCIPMEHMLPMLPEHAAAHRSSMCTITCARSHRHRYRLLRRHPVPHQEIAMALGSLEPKLQLPVQPQVQAHRFPGRIKRVERREVSRLCVVLWWVHLYQYSRQFGAHNNI